MKIPYGSAEEEEFWRQCRKERDEDEKLNPPKPLTVEEDYQIYLSIKRHKLERSRCMEDPRWPNRGRRR